MRTKHLNLLYVFVKDKIDSDNIRIQYVQTDVKRADFFTQRFKAAHSAKVVTALLKTANPPMRSRACMAWTLRVDKRRGMT
jgi:hypothetical protein